MKKSLKVVAMSSLGLAFSILLIVMGVYFGGPRVFTPTVEAPTPYCQQYRLCYVAYRGNIEKAEFYFDQPCWTVKVNPSHYKNCPKPELPNP